MTGQNVGFHIGDSQTEFWLKPVPSKNDHMEMRTHWFYGPYCGKTPNRLIGLWDDHYDVASCRDWDLKFGCYVVFDCVG